MYEIFAKPLRRSLRQENPSGMKLAYTVGAVLLAGGVIYGVRRHRKAKTPQVAPPLPPPPVT